MGSDEQFKTLIRVLRKFQDAGLLDELILIGSWCLHFYKVLYPAEKALPAVRTLDVDFLVPGASRVKTRYQGSGIKVSHPSFGSSCDNFL